MIEGKVVAVTGASSGIGAATAELLGASGARLVLGARRQHRLDALVGRLRDEGVNAYAQVTDVTRVADLRGLVACALEHFGRLDVLVSNAGIGPVSPLDDLRIEDWDAMVDVNVKGVLHGIAAALPVFREQGSGHFVHTLSTAAYKTVPGQTVYSATKVAARAITEGLRQEAGNTVRVTMVSPGFTATDFLETVPDSELRAKMSEQKRQFAITPAAIARAIAFAIDESAEVDVNEIVVRPTAQP